MYRYIGNKTKLNPYILERTQQLIGETGTVADIMAGTGSVSLELRKNGYNVIASDMMTYSYHHLMVHLKLSQSPPFLGLVATKKIPRHTSDMYADVLTYLNNLPCVQGFFFTEFSSEGTPSNGCSARKYFTSRNAAKIDAIREEINNWIQQKCITSVEESLLKHTLIMAVNEVANISGTYGYFLSTYSNNATNDISLKPCTFYNENRLQHTVKLGFAEQLAPTISADLCYIDPPYIKRQYAANYHILETIACGDFPDAVGKSGLRNWWNKHSKLCTKTRGLESFQTIITAMDCPKFLISYSEDGLFSIEQLETFFSDFGRVTTQIIDYNRFKSNSSTLSKTLNEYLILIEKE